MRRIKKIIIEMSVRDWPDFPEKVRLIEGEKLDDKIQDAISGLVEKGCGFFAENVDKITVINKKNKRLRVRADNYYYG